jgi:hypothetical protein
LFDDRDTDEEEEAELMAMRHMFGERRAARRRRSPLCLTAVAAEVLRGGAADDQGDAYLAAVATDVPAVLEAADAACDPLLRGPELRLRRFIKHDAPRAATSALQCAHAAVNAAEAAADVARRAAPMHVEATEKAARAAGAAGEDAATAAASARASATAAAEAAARLGAADADAAAAAAVAAVAAEAEELLNVVRGHVAAANDHLRDAKAAALAPAGAPAGRRTTAPPLSLNYLFAIILLIV